MTTRVAGNRFRIANGVINGMRLHVPNPEDKVRWVKEMGMSPADAIVVGDGYTDIPLLDWAGTPVLVDRNGEYQPKYKHRGYRFISSTVKILDVLEEARV